MSNTDAIFSFEQFSDFCMAQTNQPGMNSQNILDEYFKAHPTHVADFVVHFKQNSALYTQLNTEINTLLATMKPARSEESSTSGSWKDRMHQDPENRGFERF